MNNLNDSVGENSILDLVGMAVVGIKLESEDYEASIIRGGDGYVANLIGGWLNAGQGSNGELNLCGNSMTLCIRLRDSSGSWNSGLFSKHGGHNNLVYNLFTVDLGSGMDLGFEIGISGQEGMHQVKVPISFIGADRWHDIFARYNGVILDLIIDGKVVDQKSVNGQLRQGNTEPCIIGGESYDGVVVRPFRGIIDHAAIWDRALSNDEIAFLSGVDSIKYPGYYQEVFRPQFHFTPEKNWMNDPNGLVYYEGEYHLFYQHNPFGINWGHMSWGHAISTDLVQWEHLPIAISEENGIMIFSGSTVVDWGNTSGFGHNGKPPLVAIYTLSLIHI